MHPDAQDVFSLQAIVYESQPHVLEGIETTDIILQCGLSIVIRRASRCIAYALVHYIDDLSTEYIGLNACAPHGGAGKYIFIHDVCTRASSIIGDILATHAERRPIYLISLSSSVDFWRHMGAISLESYGLEVPKSYGPGACLMCFT
jgi:hypothetical protein